LKLFENAFSMIGLAALINFLLDEHNFMEMRLLPSLFATL